MKRPVSEIKNFSKVGELVKSFQEKNYIQTPHGLVTLIREVEFKSVGAKVTEYFKCNNKALEWLNEQLEILVAEEEKDESGKVH